MKTYLVVSRIAVVLAGLAAAAFAPIVAGQQIAPVTAAELTNTGVKNAIRTLRGATDEKSRRELYQLLGNDNFLLLAVREEPFPGASGKIVVGVKGAKIDASTTDAPGGGIALIAFSDKDSLYSRYPGTRYPEQKYIGIPSSQILDIVISNNYAGLLINPAGPWVWVPTEHLKKYATALLNNRFRDPGESTWLKRVSIDYSDEH